MHASVTISSLKGVHFTQCNAIMQYFNITILHDAILYYMNITRPML